MKEFGREGSSKQFSDLLAARAVCHPREIHREENQVTEPQRNLRTVPRANQQKDMEGMDLIAIQIGVTAVLLIAHFFRVVLDRVFQSA
jgi:hypothetical protein